MSGEAVKVAVRVRPFNSREKERNAKLIVEMAGPQTSLIDPENTSTSHDGFIEDDNGVLVGTGPKYASQRAVFDDLGQGVLNNAFEGYNCSLFAYGQTGSGKSYSMVGYGPNKGIVPITCDELFKAIEADKGDTKYEVTFSMLEIYNEQVRDLLIRNNPKGGLKVRENPKLGLFYVVDLKKTAVGSYEEIERRTAEGTANRTVAATNMNATSSRAHTVVTITFDQIKKNDAGEETKKSSVINLVDLAGSERADSTGATGDRLKEGAQINKSLSALGNVISALAELSTSKKKIKVPYRDSVLTKLLQNALGGNSKTVMIAALSPADINFDETLGTLRYADRAKKIKNKATVNENPMEKLIRELKEENEKLKRAMEGGMIPSEGGAAIDPGERERLKKEMEEEIKAQLLANMDAMKEMSTSWDDKLKESQQNYSEETSQKENAAMRRKTEPHLTNLNEDPQLSGVIVHFIKSGENFIGLANASPDVAISGLGVQKQHSIMTLENDQVSIKPGVPGAKTKINGAPLTGERVLQHFDRVLFGSNNLFVFNNPKNPVLPDGTPDKIDYEFAQKELAASKGFSTGGQGLSKEQQIAQEQVLELLPLVSEVNTISEELDKHRSFEVILIPGIGMEEISGNKTTKVMVKMKDLKNGNTWLWERGKFMNRRYLMQDLYQRHLDGDEDVKKIPNEEDPFWEPPEDVLIGTASIFLQSLAYGLDFDDRLTITDYKGAEEGFISVSCTPCLANGKPLGDDYFVEEPGDLLGKPYHFKVTIRNAEIHKARFSKGLTVKYRCYNEETLTQTETKSGTLSPEYNHTRIVTLATITQDHLDWFDQGCVTLQMFGRQEDSVADPRLLKMSTKELRQMDSIQDSNTRRASVIPGQGNDGGEVSQLKAELLALKRKQDIFQKKEKRIQELCLEWGKKPVEEQNFEAFHRAITAASNNYSNKLKAKVTMLSTMIQGQKFIRQTHENETIAEEGASSNGGANLGSTASIGSDVKDSKSCNIQ
ncbi:Kinesin-like protein KIF28P [Trichoplax sp. H2]|nr:Kinesin-like protein KIF28P [Trichoplax sp. H2]|eukprot:RDD47595.1 Kinesin-like protein KIF28P [Trichoplax sp. H2]